jgi:hypothetical protein
MTIYKLFDNIPIDIINGLNSIKAFSREWNSYEYQVRAGHGNIEKIAENIYNFVEYNFLPIEKRSLDAHYSIYINTKTFCFLIRQYSYYGGLTYTTPAIEQEWKNLNEHDLTYIKAIIASKLIGMYFYDSNAVNSNGRNLFSNGQKEHAGFNFNDRIIRWTDGPKRSLICDYSKYREKSNNAKNSLGHLNEIDFEAIKLLNYDNNGNG